MRGRDEHKNNIYNNYYFIIRTYNEIVFDAVSHGSKNH